MHRFLLAAAMSALSAFAPACPAQAWMPFEWIRGDFAGDADVPVVLMVPVRIDGRACRLQLDTGLNEAVAWHGPAARPGDRLREVIVEFAGISRRVPAPQAIHQVVQSGEEGCPRIVVGSLGNAFLEGGTLVLDLPHERVAYTPGSALSGRAGTEPLRYERWNGVGGYPLVEVRIDGSDDVALALLDTGSAALGIGALESFDWDRLTGGAPLQAGGDVRAFSLPSWGRQLACHRGPGRAAIRIGGRPASRLMVTHCPDLGFHPPRKLAGVVGLRSLLGSRLTIDYAGGTWRVEDAE